MVLIVGKRLCGVICTWRLLYTMIKERPIGHSANGADGKAIMYAILKD